jgi:hypothetical protein
MSGKSQNFVFSGEIFWSKVFEGQADSYDGGPEFYKITLIPDDESWAKFKASKLKLKPREVSSDDSRLAITFRRDKAPKVLEDGTELGGGTPRVLDAEGDPWDTNKLIGNGSKGQILVNRYFPKTKPNLVGHRLEAVKILKHVPYEAGGDPFTKDWSFTDEDDEPQEDAKPVKEKTTTRVKPKTEVKADMDDDLPF